MSIRIKALMEAIISRRAENNPIMAKIIMTKLILKGIDPKKLTVEADDDPVIFAKLEQMARDL